MKSIDSILKEADSIIEKKASAEKPKEPAPDPGDETVKLASMLMDNEQKPQEQEVVETPFEKIAHALAILQAADNMEELKKVTEFTSACKEKGFPDEQITDFMEKKAKSFKSPILKKILAPLLAGTAGAGAAGAVAHSKGKESGYESGYGTALKDVDQAFTNYYSS